MQLARLAALTSLFFVALGLSTVGFASGGTSSCPHHQHDYKGDYKGEVPVVCCMPKGLKDGLYIGAGVGYDVYKNRQSLELTTLSGTPIVGNPSLTAKGFMGSLFAGYGQYFSRFYIAGEVLYNYTGANTGFGLLGYDSTFNARGTYGAAMLPGVKVNNDSLFYIRLGYLRTFFKTSESGVLTHNINTTNWSGSYNLGLGLETLVYEDISLRGEYTYTSYNSFLTEADTRISPSNNEFVLAVLYHFDYV